MRWILRLTTMALAAVGAKTLYDRLAPKSEPARKAASEWVQGAKSATGRVADVAQAEFGDVVNDARAKAREVEQADAEPDEVPAP